MVSVVVQDHHFPEGVFSGRLVNNKPDGSGVAKWTTTTGGGGSYDGDWREGFLHGRGTYTYPDGGAYDGECRGSKRDGWGVCRYPGGAWYEGLYRDDRCQRGAWHDANGADVWEGDWSVRREDGMYVHEMQGWGVQKRRASGGGDGGVLETVGMWRSLETGDIYYGRFDHGKRSGSGRMLFGVEGVGDGGSYVGEWRDDMFHGRGVRLWADGTRYEGDWVCGMEHGKGTKTWARDGTSFEGVWEMGVIKSGTKTWPNGDEFGGRFYQNGCGDGSGSFKSAYGRILSAGTLKNGVFQQGSCVRPGMSHRMGCGDLEMEEDVRRLNTRVQSLERELCQVKQNSDNQTECFEHTLMHIQRGVWLSTTAQVGGSSGGFLQESSSEDSHSCVMKSVLVTLQKHNITFRELVCSLCPLDKVVKMVIAKRFGVDENQQVVSFKGDGNDTLLSETATLSLLSFKGVPGSLN
ncbi:2-isopropylmalate synthase [Pelomyxa schiedti]|nr:2-isopropylmalate synthase [Pelomyxa schiedti]